MDKNFNIQNIEKRLNIIIALLLSGLSKKNKEMDARDQIGFLSGLGLTPTEISEIMGKTSNYINKELHFIRKK